MKALALKMGLGLLKFALGNEMVHNAMRQAALKTSNSYDNAAVEAVIAYMKDVVKLLGA